MEAWLYSHPAAAEIEDSDLWLGVLDPASETREVVAPTLAELRKKLLLLPSLGDIFYGGAGGGLAKLAGNTAATRKFLRQIGDGTNATAPVWDTLTGADVGLGNVTNDAQVKRSEMGVPGGVANYSHTHDASEIVSGVLDVARIPVLPSQVQVTSAGALANLTALQQAQIGQGSVVTTTDGRRWVYSGSGSKTAEASYIELADITPDWSVIANKPQFGTMSLQAANNVAITGGSATGLSELGVAGSATISVADNTYGFEVRGATQKFRTLSGNATYGTTLEAVNLAGNAYTKLSLIGSEIMLASGASPVGSFTSTGLNACAIGQTTAAAGSFTTLSASGNVSTSGDVLLTPGKALKYSATSYITPEDNIQGARIKTAGGIVLETGSAVSVTGALSATGAISSTQFRAYGTAAVLIGDPAGVASQFVQLNNTAGALYVGLDDSTGSVFASGGYANVLYGAGSYPWRIAVGGTGIATISATGLAVTGALGSQRATSASTYQLDCGASGIVANGLLFRIGGVASLSNGFTGLINSAGTGLVFAANGDLSVTGALSATGALGVDGQVSVTKTGAAAVLQIKRTDGGATIDIRSRTDQMQIGTTDNFPVNVYVNGAQVASFQNGSLAVTGALSSTTRAYFTDAGAVTPSATQGGWMFTNPQSTGSLASSGTATGPSTLLSIINGNGVVGSIGTSGSATQYNTSSDARLKTNIRDFTDSGRLIDALRPRLYDWRSGEKDAIGFVAQEEHTADPVFARIGAVTVGDDDPDVIHKQWQRSDSALVPILVAEVKSLRARVAVLEQRIAA